MIAIIILVSILRYARTVVHGLSILTAFRVASRVIVRVVVSGFQLLAVNVLTWHSRSSPSIADIKTSMPTVSQFMENTSPQIATNCHWRHPCLLVCHASPHSSSLSSSLRFRCYSSHLHLNQVPSYSAAALAVWRIGGLRGV